jgi:sortase (surface protein transpeptidase)
VSRLGKPAQQVVSLGARAIMVAGLIAVIAGATQVIESPAATATRVDVGQLDRSAGAPSGGHPQVATPVHITIPSVGIDADLVYLRVGPDGTLPAPARFTVAGWWAGGARPGAPGPAVIEGHVDTYRGPAVFYRVRDLKPGDVVTVGRRDGSTVRFVVQALRQFPKRRFPTNLVYGATSAPTLRLITCGGAFDHHTGHYEDNVVVFAHLAGSKPAAPDSRASRTASRTQPGSS